MRKISSLLVGGFSLLSCVYHTPLVANDLNQTSSQYSSQSEFLPGYDLSDLPHNYGIFTNTDDDSLLTDQGDWLIEGYLNLDARYIDLEGDRSRSPLPFDGSQQFAEIGAQFLRESANGQRWSGELAGIINDSEYRGAETGVTLERFHTEWSAPGVGRSLRLRGGDFQASWSPRSLQRALKGVQAELQTNQSWFGTQHSLQFISGVESPDFRDLNSDRGWFNGVSSLWRANTGSVIVNLLNHQGGDLFGRVDEDQWLVSVGAEQRLNLSERIVLNVEAELSYLDRDNDALTDQDSGGAYFALNGRIGKALGFDARYEDYDADFVPAGRSIVNDRRSQELRLNWNLTPGLRSSLRLQEFIDQRGSANPRTTRSVGGNLAGNIRVFDSPMSLNLNAFSRERFDDQASIDEVSDNLSAELSFSSSPLWSHRLRLNYLDNEDFLDGGNNTAIELGYNIGRTFQVREWRGFIESGVTVRDVENRSQFSQVNSDELGFVLSGRVQRGPYRHQLSYRSQDQDREQNELEDLQREDFSYQFEYRQRQHQLRLDIRHFANDPDPGLGIEAQEISLSYRYEFELTPNKAYTVNPPEANSDFLLVALRPGLSARAQRDLLAQKRLGTGVPQAGFQVFDYTLFDQVNGRQRLAIELGPAGDIRQSVLLVDVEANDRDQIERDYYSIRKQLVNEIGQPSRSIVTGQFSELSASAIQSQAFAREEKWQSSNGTILLVIPERGDGRVRLEVRHSRDNYTSGSSRSEFEALGSF